MRQNSQILVAGSRGLVGSAIVESLLKDSFTNVLAPTRQELDLLNWKTVDDYFEFYKPEFVFFAAAKVGGVLANQTYPADFIVQNTRIQNNLFEACNKHNVKKLLFLASSCVYPRNASQPINENLLWSGPLDPAHSPYATAKLAGIEMCSAYRRQYGKDFISVIPTNIYGPRDRFGDLQNSHVVPALLTKFHIAKQMHNDVEVWGDGSSRRDLLYSTDVAEACIFLMERYSSEKVINLGSGTDHTIAELVDVISQVTEYEGKVVFDESKPTGTPRRMLDTKKINDLGWFPRFDLKQGMSSTYSWLKENINQYDL